jgi:hypothetical protein
MVLTRQAGLVADLDRRALVAAGHDADCVLELLPIMSDFVPAGAPLFRIHGQPVGKLDHKRIARRIVLSAERTHDDDRFRASANSSSRVVHLGVTEVCIVDEGAQEQLLREHFGIDKLQSVVDGSTEALSRCSLGTPKAWMAGMLRRRVLSTQSRALVGPVPMRRRSRGRGRFDYTPGLQPSQ